MIHFSQLIQQIIKLMKNKPHGFQTEMQGKPNKQQKNKLMTNHEIDVTANKHSVY